MIAKDYIWDKKTHQEVLESVKQYLDLYMFKASVPNLKNAVKNIFKLNETDLNYLKSVHFLLSNEVQVFVNILPQLLRNLSHSTNKKELISKGVVRGSVDWNQTLKTRYSQGFNDYSLFSCNCPTKLYDLEENQLLKFILKNIVLLANNLNLNKNSKYWENKINDIYFEAKTSLYNVYFQNISDLKIVSPKIVRKAYNHRNNFYKKAVEVYKKYEAIFIREDRQELVNLVSNQILEPLNYDQLYELFVFFNLIDCLPQDNLDLGLLRKGNMYAANYNDEIKIHYQNVPEDFKQDSIYKGILANYDINSSSKRPDIIIEFIGNGKSSYRLIEVKRSKDLGYIYQSVYKVLGYLKDYENIELCENIPAVLVLWDGIAITGKNAFDKELLIFNKKEFLKNKNYLVSSN